MGAWDAFWSGAQMGEHYGDMRRNREAFQDGGYDGVERAAANVGDMQTAMSTRRFQDDQHQQAFQWFEQNAPYARNVLRRARAIQDPQHRGAFLQSQRQRFEGMGVQPDQIDGALHALTNPETAEEAFASYDAAFTQHQDPNWEIKTMPTEGGGYEQRAIGVGPDGFIQQGPNAIPGAGGAGRYATPDEIAQAGYRPGSVVWLVPGQPPRVVQAPNAGRAGASDAAPSLPSGFQWED